MGLIEREQQLNYHAVRNRLRNLPPPLNTLVEQKTVALHAEIKRLWDLIKERDEIISDLRAKPPEPLDIAYVTIHNIILLVCKFEGLTCEELQSSRRNVKLVRARHIGFYLCRKYSQCSYPQIGRRFGGRDHTTVLHGVEKIEGMMETDKLLRRKINFYVTQLNAITGEAHHGPSV